MKVTAPGIGLTAVAPVTQAFSDAAAVGTAVVAARGDHRHGMPVRAQVPALVLADDTEYSDTTVGAHTIHQFAGLNIPATSHVRVLVPFRKSAGAANSTQIGLSINGVQHFPNTQCTSALNNAESGIAVFDIGPATAVYGFASVGLLAGSGVVATALAASGARPNAAITTIEVTGQTLSALITEAIKGVRIIVMPDTVT